MVEDKSQASSCACHSEKTDTKRFADWKNLLIYPILPDNDKALPAQLKH